MSKLLKNTFYYSLGEICPRIISFFLLPIYTTFLSPSDYGILSYTNSIMFFLLVFGSLSLNSFVLRYYFIRKTDEERKRLVGGIYVTIGIINVFIFAFSCIFFPILISKYDIQIPWEPYFKLALIINFLDSFSTIPLIFYRVKQEALQFVALNLGKTLLQVILNIYFIAFLKIGLIGYYYASLLTFIPFFLIYWWIMRKHTVFCFNISEIKEGLKYSLPLLPGALAYLILSTSDRIILERNVSMAQIGVYNVACTLALALNIIIQSGYKAIEPEIYKRHGSDNYYGFIKKIQSAFFVVVYAAGLAISLFSQEVFYYMTSGDFHEGYKLVPILIIGVVMTGQNVIYSGVLSADKSTKVIGLATLIGAAFSLSFNIFLIPIWGVYAAAISSAISFTIMNMLLFLKMRFTGKSMYKEAISAILIFIISYFFIELTPQVSLSLLGMKLVVVLVYTLFLLKLFQFDRSDFMKLKHIAND